MVHTPFVPVVLPRDIHSNDFLRQPFSFSLQIERVHEIPNEITSDDEKTHGNYYDDDDDNSCSIYRP